MGPVSQVGIHSDIYLMGAILYEIIAGHAPHTGSTVTQCLMAAARNEILPTTRKDELVEIATHGHGPLKPGRAAMPAWSPSRTLSASTARIRRAFQLSARADDES